MTQPALPDTRDLSTIFRDGLRLALQHPRWTSLAVLLIFAVAISWGIVSNAGTIRGHDAAINSYAEYEARNSTWSYLWDDLRFPGMPRPVTRTTTTQFGLIGLTNLIGSATDAMRFMQFGLVFMAAASMYFLTLRYTKSHLAGITAGIIFVVNRGAPFQSQLAFAAGYALLPLAFLTADMALRNLTLRAGAYFGIVMALITTSTILPFSYIAFIFVGVYVFVYLVNVFRKLQPPEYWPTFVPIGKVLLGSVAVFAVLSTYLILTVLLSTAQVVQSEGGYEIEDVARRAVNLWQAITLEAAGGFIFDNSLISVANFLLAMAAVAAVIRLRTYWTVAMLLIAVTSVFFASQVNSPIYGFLFDNLPWFSLVRIARRWEAITLLSYAVLASTWIPVIVTVIKENRQNLAAAIVSRGNWKSASVVGSVVVTFAILPLVIVANWGGVANWLTAYKLPNEFVDPYEWVRETDDNAAIAGVPFLEARVTDDFSLITGDYSRHLGPSVADKPLLTGFRVGGLSVNADLRQMIAGFETAPVFTHDLVTSDGIEQELTDRRWRNFYLQGTLRAEGTDTGTVLLQFRRQAEFINYSVIFDFGEDTASLERLGAKAEVFNTSDITLEPGQDYKILVVVQDSHMRVLVNGVLLLTGTDDSLQRGNLSFVSRSTSASLSEVRMTSLSEPLYPEQGLSAVLGLFNIGYLVVQPHASPEETALLASVPGFTVGFEGPESSVLVNNDYYPVLNSPNRVALVIGGEKVDVLMELANLPGFKFRSNLVLFLQDLNDEQLELISPEIDYLVFAGNRDEELHPALKTRVPELPSLILFSQRDGEFASVDESLLLIEDLTLTDETVEVIDRSLRAFIVETDISFSLTDEPSIAGIQIKKRSRNNFYSVNFNPGNNRVSVSRQQGVGAVLLDSVFVPGLGVGSHSVRVASSGPEIEIYVDNVNVLVVSDATYARGSISFSSEAGSTNFENGVAKSPAVGSAEYFFFASEGFADGKADVETDPALVNSVSLDVNLPDSGEFSALIGWTGQAEVFLSQIGQSTSEAVALQRETAINDVQMNELTGEEIPRNWITTQRFEIEAGLTRFNASAIGEQPLLDTVVLISNPSPDADLTLPFVLGDPADDGAVEFKKNSPVSYRITTGDTRGRFLVFKDSADSGWVASDSLGAMTRVPAYGFFNAFLVPANADPLGSFTLEYRPNLVYRVGILISALALFGTVGALVLGPRMLGRVRESRKNRSARLVTQPVSHSTDG